MTNGLFAIFWTLVGTAVGSFLNVVADRLPEGQSLLSPPSRCEACGRWLTPVELVPVWSYLALRGRCRTCGAPLGLRTLFVELGTGLLFALAASTVAPTDVAEYAALVLSSAYLAVLVVVTVTDLERGLILNRAIVPAIALGLVGALLSGWPRLLFHLGGALLGGGIIALIILVVPGGMGWGDARLAAFIGLVTGLPGALFALFITFVSGGLVAGALLINRRRQPGDTVPLGPFLAFGGAAALLYQDQMVRAFHVLSSVVRM